MTNISITAPHSYIISFEKGKEFSLDQILDNPRTYWDSSLSIDINLLTVILSQLSS